MKRPNAEQIRAELNLRRLHEAEAMARSHAMLNARIGDAAKTLVAARDRDLDDFEAAIGRSARATAIDKASGPTGSRSS